MSQAGNHQPAPEGRFNDIYPLLSAEAKSLAAAIRKEAIDVGAVSLPCTPAVVVDRARAAAERLQGLLAQFLEALP